MVPVLVQCRQNGFTTPALLEDGVDGGGPDERLGVVAPGLEEVPNGGDQVGHAGEDAAAQRLLGELPKPALDEVQPGAAGGGEAQMEARILGKPGSAAFELALSRADGTYLKVLAGLAKVELLILDDWGLVTLDAQASADIMDVVDDRAGLRSTIVTSQLPVSEWHSLISDASIADALLDRLVHRAVRIELKGESMRKEAPQRSPKLT